MSGGISMGAVLTAVGASIAGAVVSKALTKSPSQPQTVAAADATPPVVEAPTAMPTVNDAERRSAQRRSIATQMARRGRASTILTDSTDDKLGG